jgi:hypothetical protein
VALIITVLVFAGFFCLASKELSGFIQTRFYNPYLTKSIAKETVSDADLAQTHIFNLQKKFSNILNEPAVLNSFLYNQNPGDISERSRIFGLLLEEVPGLQYVQFIDMNGIRLHYSTASRDIISQNNSSTVYRNYTDDDRALPYEQVSVPANNGEKYTMDEEHDRIIFSFPFTDSMNVYCGTALFTFSVRAFSEISMGEGRIKADVSVIASPPGIVIGKLETSKTEILRRISKIWSGAPSVYVSLTAVDSNVSYALISVKTNYGLYYGRLIEESILSISPAMKLIMQLSLFLTFYLTLLLILNFRPEPVTLVRSHINKLRVKLLDQLYFNRSSHEREKWILELEQRRDEIRKELKSKLKLKRKGVNSEKNIDSIINKSWEELLIFIRSGVDLKNDFNKIKQKTFRIGETVIADKSVITDEIWEFEELAESTIMDDVAIIDKVSTLDEFEELEELEGLEEVDETAITDEAFEASSDETFTGEILTKDKSSDKAAIEDKFVKASLADEEAAADENVSTRRGLLALASSGIYQNVKTQRGRGLLAFASNEKFTSSKTNSRASKGLLAVASEIEFSKLKSVSALNDESAAAGADNDPYVDINIVSPFAAMFSSVDEDE